MAYSRTYTNYLKSEAWKTRRLIELEKANWQCKMCGERELLQVHHLTYERLGKEKSSDLVVLCRSCHWVADELRKGNDELLRKYQEPFRSKKKTKKEIRAEIKRRKKAQAKRKRLGPWTEYIDYGKRKKKLREIIR